MSEIFLILISTSLANNLVLNFMLGVDPLVATSRKPGPALDTCLFMITTMPVVSLVAFITSQQILNPFIPASMHLVSTVLVISITVMLTGILTQKSLPDFFRRIEKVIPLMMVNCTLLGVVLIGNNYIYSFITAFVFGLGTALGFSLVLMMFVSIRNKLAGSDIPEPLQGTAIIFITLGILSMGFMGFSGIALP